MEENKPKRGRPRNLKEPNELWEMFLRYRNHVKQNPRIKYEQNQRSGEVVPIPIVRPLTLDGFESYAWEFEGMTISNYLDNQNDAYQDFYAISTHIKKTIRGEQLDGGMAGQYNASLTARINGLSESINNNVNVDQPLFVRPEKK